MLTDSLKWKVGERRDKLLMRIFPYTFIYFQYFFVHLPYSHFPLICPSAPLLSEVILNTQPSQIPTLILAHPHLSFGGSSVPVWSFICVIYIPSDSLLCTPNNHWVLQLPDLVKQPLFVMRRGKKGSVTGWAAIQRKLIVKKKKKTRGNFVSVRALAGDLLLHACECVCPRFIVVIGTRTWLDANMTK